MRCHPTLPGSALCAGGLVAVLSLPLAAQDPVYEIREFLRVGGADAPVEEAFIEAERLSLALGPNEQLLVLDLEARTIRVFGPDGRFVRSIAGPGKGPGEVDGTTALGFDAGSRLWIQEPFRRRYSVFDSTGVFLHTVPRPGGATPRLTGRIEFDEAGRLMEMGVDTAPFIAAVDPSTGEVMEAYSPFRVRVGATGVPRLFVELPESVQEALRLLRNRRVWDWSSDGRTWVAWTGEGRVVERSPDGDTLRVMEAPGRSVRTTAAERSLIDQARHHLGNDDIELGPQVVQSIIRLGSGRLLVQRAEELNAPGRTFEVFEPDGGYAGTVQFPIPIAPHASPAVRGDSLFVVGFGDYDAPVVLGMALTPRAPRR